MNRTKPSLCTTKEQKHKEKGKFDQQMGRTCDNMLLNFAQMHQPPVILYLEQLKLLVFNVQE